MSKVKYSIIIIAAVLIGIAVYSSILFLLVEDRNAVFYINYGFTVFSFLAFLGAMLSVLIKPKDLKTAFLNEPYVSIAMIYAGAQFLFEIWAIFYNEASWQIALSVDILFCGAYLICLLFLIAGITLNKEIEVRVDQKRKFLNLLQADLKSLTSNSAKVRQALQEFGEDVRYSDPMSRGNHTEIEAKIIDETQKLADIINDEDEALEKLSQLKRLLKKRNDYIKYS